MQIPVTKVKMIIMEQGYKSMNGIPGLKIVHMKNTQAFTDPLGQGDDLAPLRKDMIKSGGPASPIKLFPQTSAV